MIINKQFPLYIDGKLAGTVKVDFWEDGYLEISGMIVPQHHAALKELQVVNLMPERKPKY